MTEFHVVIPARYASTRLPGKPLVDIAGKPMIQHVYERTQESMASQVLVATDDTRIVEAVEGFGGKVCLTRADHPSGTDRLAEVATMLGLADDDIMVNVQGDEPLIPAAAINQVAANLAQFPEAGIATLCEPIVDVATFLDPNVVKVCRSSDNLAHYFSRAPIPWPRDHFQKDRNSLPEGFAAFRHIGIYAYRVGFLHRYVTWSPAVLETTECLEQLRALWNGVKIHVEEACVAIPAGVDTPHDLDKVRAILQHAATKS